MSKVKLNLRSLSPTEKTVKARQIISSLMGNPDFTTPHPPLTQITASADALDVAFADVQTAKQNVLTKNSILRESSDTLDGQLRQLAAYIESVSGDDESKILSAGVGVKNVVTSGIGTPLTAPAGLSAAEGDHDGEIDLNWDKVKNAKSYVIERSSDPPTATSWVHETVSLKSSTTISGLTSGTRYWFRVAAVVTVGQTGWSDPSTKIAP
ncbi:MAG: fibronectin type III domain-containing protein [Blastocatellia bacterium]